MAFNDTDKLTETIDYTGDASTPRRSNRASTYQQKEDQAQSVPTAVAKQEIEKTERKFKEIKLPDFKEFLKAGVQFGHQTNKWNPKMGSYIHTSKNGIHVIDLNKTLEMLSKALTAVQQSASKGNVLFVGTKSQAHEILKSEAMRCGAFFVDSRWAGGLLTNYKTIRQSLDKLNDLEMQFEEGVENRTKQEISWMKKDWERLNRLYGGVKGMKELPVMIFVVDVNFEKGAVEEAKSLDIPIVAICDTNVDPEGITYKIPSNDDAVGAIKLVTGLVADAVLDGNQGSGVKHVFKDYLKMEIEKK